MGRDSSSITIVGVRLTKHDLFVNKVPREGLRFDPKVFVDTSPPTYDEEEEEGWIFQGYPIHFVHNMVDNDNPSVYICAIKMEKSGPRGYVHDEYVSTGVSLEDLIVKREEMKRILHPLGLFPNFDIHCVVEFSW